MTNVLIEGITIGSLYALIALGPSLVYGLMRVLDIANAAVLTLGAYLMLIFVQITGSSFLGIVAAMVVGAAIGWLLQRYLYVPIFDRGPIVTLITSIGLYIAAGEILRLVFGALQQNIGADMSIPPIQLGDITVLGIDWIIIIVGIGILAATWAVLSKTRYGLVWRAVAQDREIASTIGINSKRVIGSVFIIGYALSALAGVLYGLRYDVVHPTMGDIPAYKMLAIIILGGLGSPLGTIIAALLIGIVETLVVATIGFIIPRDAVAFAALVIILLIRPQGILPSRVVRV